MGQSSFFSLIQGFIPVLPSLALVLLKGQPCSSLACARQRMSDMVCAAEINADISTNLYRSSQCFPFFCSTKFSTQLNSLRQININSQVSTTVRHRPQSKQQGTLDSFRVSLHMDEEDRNAASGVSLQTGRWLCHIILLHLIGSDYVLCLCRNVDINF